MENCPLEKYQDPYAVIRDGTYKAAEAGELAMMQRIWRIVCELDGGGQDDSFLLEIATPIAVENGQWVVAEWLVQTTCKMSSEGSFGPTYIMVALMNYFE